MLSVVKDFVFYSTPPPPAPSLLATSNDYLLCVVRSKNDISHTRAEWWENEKQVAFIFHLHVHANFIRDFPPFLCPPHNGHRGH